MTHIFLFDIDGVLVDAVGYLRGLQDTVAEFSVAMRVGNHPPTELEVRCFEANGLSNEWDSGAACVGCLLVERVLREPVRHLPAEWPALLSVLSGCPVKLPHPDYPALARDAGVGAQEGVPAGEAAFEALWRRAETGTLAEEGRTALRTLLWALLGETHSFENAPFTRAFQQRVVGSDAVWSTYGVRPDIQARSYLLEFDRPLLSAAVRQQLLEAVRDGRIRAALYTARPSLPPVEAAEDRQGHSPEAELAAGLVGLDGLPLIGAGRMWWLAGRHGLDPARLVKPSPVQALAAIGAAARGNEAAALEAALALHRNGVLMEPLSRLHSSTVHTFEDAPNGLTAATRAVSELSAAGVPVTLRQYGITPETGPKAETMASRGVTTYRSVDDAVRFALASVP